MSKTKKEAVLRLIAEMVAKAEAYQIKKPWALRPQRIAYIKSITDPQVVWTWGTLAVMLGLDEEISAVLSQEWAA